jgi:hypothetical protein
MQYLLSPIGSRLRTPADQLITGPEVQARAGAARLLVADPSLEAVEIFLDGAFVDSVELTSLLRTPRAAPLFLEERTAA